MLVYSYLFALIVGMVLLGASILLGGDGDSDADADADADADGGLDHASPDADAGAHHGHADVGGHGTADFFLWSFRSIRFWTFFLAFFGLTGLALTWLGLVDSAMVALGLAVGMGAASGLGATAALRRLSTDESGAIASSSDYIGKTARVLIPVQKDGTGKVRIQLRGNTVDVLATTDDDEPLGAREEALIIEMEGSRARIARLPK